MTTQEIVSKLWNLCNVLRDDGITYHQYVTELTYILFLKMAKETDKETKFAEGITLQEGKDGQELTPEQETYYQYTCLPGDYIKMCTVPTPRLDATDLAREKKMLEL